MAISVGLFLGVGLGPEAVAQPTINDATGVEVAPARPAAERDAPAAGVDRRPFYVAAGIVFLGALFLWNRRRRAELERDEEAFMRKRRAQARAARTGRGASDGDASAPPDDPDAADLRRAARGDEEHTP